MTGAHDFLQAQAVVLCTAALTTVVCHRLRLPVVLGYVLAGLIIGPHVPIPLVADPGIVQVLSEQGVILLMFSLGLEFSLRRLVQLGPTAGLTAVVQCSGMMWLGYAAAQALGWTVRESLYAGAIVAISSTTIIAKAFDEQRVRGPLRDLVVGVLIVEDLIAVLLVTALTALSGGEDVSAGALLNAAGKLGLFLVALLVGGMLLVPRAVRAVVRLDRPETTLVFSVGVCFAAALLAQSFGYSVALGAFLAGSLVAESGVEKAVEHLVQPVRDMFAAVFFVSVGMLLDPVLVVQNAGAVAVFTLVVLVGKVLGVSLGAFLSGQGPRLSVQVGMSLAQIGEFSFIIAALGMSLRATREFLYPVAVSVSVITTLTTPWLIRSSGSVAAAVERALPPSLRTFAELYATWVERLRTAPREPAQHARLRRLVELLAADAALLAALVVGVALFWADITAWLHARTPVDPAVLRAAVLGAAALLALPFLLGLGRLARGVGMELAQRALPPPGADQVDTAEAPRHALALALQLAMVLAVGVPLAVLTQPFLPVPAALVPAAGLAALTVVFWRSTQNLDGHLRAGVQVVAETLAAQSGTREPPTAAELHARLPGLEAAVPVLLDDGAPAVGRTLAELDLRHATGATVLGILRAEGTVPLPTAHERLRAGDVLALAGTPQAVGAARVLLGGPDHPVHLPPPG